MTDNIVKFGTPKPANEPAEDVEVAASCEALAQFLKENRASIQSFVCAVDNGNGDFRIFTTPISALEWSFLNKLLELRLNRNIMPNG